mgnify:FL=1
MSRTRLRLIVSQEWMVYSLCLLAGQGARAVADPGAVEQLRSPDVERRMASRLKLESERQTCIRNLIAIVASQPHDAVTEHAVVDSIELLGKFRAREASKCLADKIMYVPRCVRFIAEAHPLNRFPAAKALVEIGNPGVSEVLVRLTKTPSENELRIMAFVIYLVDGKELGLCRLQIAQEQDSRRGSTARKDSLSRLIEIYKATDFQDHTNWPE